MDERMEMARHIDGSEAVVDTEFIKLVFQHGHPQEVGINGCRIEDVIDVLMDKLHKFQSRELACEENSTALYHLDMAREALRLRRRRREQQGVLGMNVVHKAK